MTGKRTTKKVASPAELKRQVAAEKARGDRIKEEADARMEKLFAVVEGLSAEVKLLSEPKPVHDQSERMINSVLKEDGTEHYPERNPDNLPPQLKVAQAKMKDLLAKNTPTSIRDTVDSNNEEIGEYKERPMQNTGAASISLAPLEPTVQIEKRTYTKEKLDIELFMHEQVLVRVFDSTDETQIEIPEVCNRGARQFFVRGQMQWVKRKFIEPLARAKKTTYTQRKQRMDNGDEQYINVPHTALMYPFEVLEDTPQGKAWLRGILAEAY